MATSQCPYAESIDAVISNFDREVVAGAEERLRTEEVCGTYPAWNFYGTVWWDRDAHVFKCEVWCFGTPREVMKASSLSDLMRLVSEKYGWR